MAMLELLPPGALMLLLAPLLFVLRGRALQVALVTIPLASAVHLGLTEVGTTATLMVTGGLELTPVRVDPLSRVWGGVFHLAALATAIFSLGVKDRVQHVAALVYAGSATTAVFAGDLVSLFVSWELTGLASVFLIWARRTPEAYAAGLRYLVVMVLSGVLLLAGLVVRLWSGAGADFGHLGLTGTVDTTLIFLAFGVKAAFPLLHGWVKDAYPEATPTGAVWLSAFSTKLAIYALARGFAGAEPLLVLGAVMAIFPLVLAAMEDDLRRVLAYGLINQLGFMVVGVGVGTDLALNGVAAHAVAHIVYKGLLFMVMGAVLLRTGTARASELGGLWRRMPWTTLFALVGAAAIGLPFFSGFTTKSLELSAAAHEGHVLAYAALVFGSAAVFHQVGLRLPHRVFFGEDAGHDVEEAPTHMLVAMGILAALCVGIGVAPDLLYAWLPFQPGAGGDGHAGLLAASGHGVPEGGHGGGHGAIYEAYTIDHLVNQMQIVLGATVAYVLLRRQHWEPADHGGAVLDADALYRGPLRWAALAVGRGLGAGVGLGRGGLVAAREGGVIAAYRLFGPHTRWARTWSTNGGVLAIAILLTLYVLAYFQLGDPTTSAVLDVAP